MWMIQGIQLINKVGKVVGGKVAKVVNKISTGEKGETVRVLACVLAEDRFLPPKLILSGKSCKHEFQYGLPSELSDYMNPK